MYCSGCGCQNQNGAKFCKKCGMALSPNSGQSIPPGNVVQGMPSGQAARAVMAKRRRWVIPGVVAAVAIFLIAFGVIGGGGGSINKVIPLSDIEEEFYDNVEKTKKKYEDKDITIEGYIEITGVDMLIIQGNRDGKSNLQANCPFRAVEIEDLEYGDKVTISGRCTSVQPLGLFMKNCKIVLKD